jgi:hypothetical protein
MIQWSRVPDHVGWYLAGFSDGEGSFNITFRRSEDRALPFRVGLRFNVSQKDRVILTQFKRYVQCGQVRYRSDGVWWFEVDNLRAIRENVIPFFRRFRFRSAKKKRDFAIFQEVAQWMADGRHQSLQGLRDILEIRRRMNDGGNRKIPEEEILRILNAAESSETARGTPKGDDIVRTPSRGGAPGPAPGDASADSAGRNVNGGS